jgi:branched-chain amino acid transport system ATP-binding protein
VTDRDGGLSVDGLTVGYGGLVANDRVSLDVRPGQVVGLIGPNGAGKSTFVDAVTGFVDYRGSVRLGPVALDGLAPHQRARLGLTRTWQSVELFDDLTVRANVAVAHRTVTPRSFLRDIVNPGRGGDRARVDWILKSLGLDGVADARPRELALGQRKRLGVARALAGSPLVALLDEPASGLDPAERRQLGAQIRALADGGLGVLLIEHDVDMVLSTCERVVVLNFGVVIADGSPDEIRRDRAVAEAYLGDRFHAHGVTSTVSGAAT